MQVGGVLRACPPCWTCLHKVSLQSTCSVKVPRSCDSTVHPALSGVKLAKSPPFRPVNENTGTAVRSVRPSAGCEGSITRQPCSSHSPSGRKLGQGAAHKGRPDVSFRDGCTPFQRTFPWQSCAGATIMVTPPSLQFRNAKPCDALL